MTSIAQRVTPNSPTEAGIATVLGGTGAFVATKVIAPSAAVHQNKKAWADLAKTGHAMDKLAITKELKNSQLFPLSQELEVKWAARDVTVAREANANILRKFGVPILGGALAFAGAAAIMNALD